MTTRQSVLYAILSSALLIAVLAGCSAGNPYMSTAEDAMQAQSYERALANVDSAIARDTANVDAYLLKADVLREMADSTMPPDEYKEYYRRALQAEQRAIKMDPSVRSDAQTKQRLAYIQEYQRGADAFNRARKEQDNATYLRAASYFGAAAVTQPDSAGPYLNEAYARLNADQREEAIPLLESYVQRADSVQENAYTILGQLYLTNSRPDDAISILEQAGDQYPQNEEIQSLLLNAYNQAGRTEQAMETYREQIERNPENATYRYNYGSLLLEADRFDEAIEHLGRAVELDPQDPQKQYNLGAAYVNKGAAVQDSLNALQERIREADREPTQEEAQRLKELVQQRKQLFTQAIAPLEKARQMTDRAQQRQRACSALFQAYVQTEQQQRAQEVQKCAEASSMDGGGNSGGGGN